MEPSPPDPPRVRRCADSPRVPWRNGGGTSRTLRPEAGDDGWWVAVADLERAGPFSAYPGVQRVFTPLGAVVDLVVGGVAHRVADGEPFTFDGGAAVELALPEGPAVALNVFADRTRCRAAVRLHRGGGSLVTGTALVVTEGSAHLPDGRVLGPLDLVEGAARVEGAALVVEVTSL